MMTQLADADRALAPTVSHVMALAITAILISGLLISANAIYSSQGDTRAREQLETIGNRLADEIARASRLASDGGNLSITTHHQSQVGGSAYTVSVLTDTDCDTPLFSTETCLELTRVSDELSVKVPVKNETPISLSSSGAGTFTISTDPSGTGSAQLDPPANIDRTMGVGSIDQLYLQGQDVNLTNRKPLSGFVFTPGQPTVDSVIHFENDTDDLDGVIENYEWDLGDGTVRTGVRQLNHSYAKPGKYNVTLTVTDDDGQSDSVSKVVVVAGLVYDENATAGDVSGSVQDGNIDFSVTNKHEAEVTVKELYLDPKDDSIDGLSETESGVYEIEIDGDADDHLMNAEIVIRDGGYVHELAEKGNQAETNISAGQSAPIEFNGFDEEANDNDTPKVDMQDKEVFVSIHYQVGGDFFSTQFTLFGPTQANDPPSPSFTYSCSDRDCSFDATGTTDDGSITSYEWDFGDGTNGTGATPSNTYPSFGEYDGSLTVTDDDGVTSTLTKTVAVSKCGGSDGVEWYNDAWNHRKEIEIDAAEVAGSSVHENFPLLVYLTGDSDLANGAQSDGDDILFADGCEKLAHEIDTFDSTNGDLAAWVNVTGLSPDVNTTIHLYYDNSGASNQEDVTAVWDSDYRMVQHFEETSGDALDSTAYDNDGTTVEVEYREVDGKIGNAHDFEENDESGIVVPDDSSLDITAEVTLSAWIHPWNTNNWKRIVAKSHFVNNYPYTMYGLLFDSNSHLRMEIADCDQNADSTCQESVNGVTTVGTSTWTYAVATFDGSELRVYFDGSLDNSASESDTIATNDEDLTIGRSGFDDDYFDGLIDEVRVSATTRSDDWIQTKYNNQEDPNSFYSVSREQAKYLESGGEVVMETENYHHARPGNGDDGAGDDMSDQTWTTISDSNASDGTALEATPNQGDNAQDTTNGERLDYYVDFSTTGTYYVWVRMKCPSGSDDSVHAGLNQSPESYGDLGLTGCSDSWTWVQTADGSAVTVDVTTAGDHQFNLWMREDGTKIDKIVLTTDSSYTPSGTGPSESATT